jgi:hypothetical protein
MKAKYVGDPTQPKGAETVPDEMEAFGLTFEKGKFTAIEDPALFQRLQGNNHFETEGKAPDAEK